MKKRSPLTFNSENIRTLTPDTIESHVQPHEHSSKKGRVGRRFLAAHLSHEAIKQLGLLAVQQERTKQAMLIEAINDLFTKYGLSRIADE